MNRSKNLVIIILLLGILISACRKDKGDPPVLPPSGSFVIDFSNFEPGKNSDNILLSKGIENSNWEFSAVVAGYFRSLITTTLAVPVTAFQRAASQSPAYLDDKTWQWKYNVSFLSTTYQARLTGQTRTTDVLWKMYISAEGSSGFDEFLWFEGTSQIDGSSGKWSLNHSNQYQELLLKIEWTEEIGETNYLKVKYTYERTLNDDRDDDPFNSSYIEYGRSSGVYDSYYNIYYYNGLKFSNMSVEWNSVTRNGRVKCSDFFGDDLWHCWDGNYVNITC